MSYTIYLRTNKVNGMRYVGQTKDFRRREWDWSCLKTRYANCYIDEDREKYGLDNFNVVIIDHCETQEEAWELEQKYIKELGTKYPDGYNMSEGGETNKGMKHSEESKIKMSEAKKGIYTGEKSYWYGKHRSEESKKKMSERAKGRKHSEEWKKYMSKKMGGANNPMYGKHLSEEAIRKRIEKISKPINQYDLNGNFIKRWNSAREAARELGYKNHSNITGCCKGKYGFKTAYNSIWKYAED